MDVFRCSIDVFRCSIDVLRCSQIFSDVLRMLSIGYRYSLNILRRIQGVFRSFQMSSDDCRFSQDVLGIFFLVFLKIFSGWSGGSIGLVGPSGSLGPSGWV